MIRMRLILVAAAIVGWCSACERCVPTRAGGRPSARTSERSPRATIERLIAAHESGSYQSMSALIVPGRADEVVTTLMAVDGFLRANQGLCEYVRDEFALGLSQSIDCSAWGARLGVFSPYAELIEESVEGSSATVSFSVDGRVPLQVAHLARIDGAWRYDPGPGYDVRLPAAFRQMARGLRQVLSDLENGRLSADAIRADPQRLLGEVRVRLLPGIKMLPAGPSTQPGGD